jgi:hypothetical protein
MTVLKVETPISAASALPRTPAGCYQAPCNSFYLHGGENHLRAIGEPGSLPWQKWQPNDHMREIDRISMVAGNSGLQRTFSSS